VYPPPRGPPACRPAGLRRRAFPVRPPGTCPGSQSARTAGSWAGAEEEDKSGAAIEFEAMAETEVGDSWEYLLLFSSLVN
jgi:hypothetical protein